MRVLIITLRIITILSTALIFSCSGFIRENEFERYGKIIKSYDCHRLESERKAIEDHLVSLKKMQSDSFFEKIMESIISLGIFTYSAHRDLDNNIEIVEEKLKEIRFIKNIKNCL